MRKTAKHNPASSPQQSSGADFHTDLGNARRLVARHGMDIRFIPEWGKWIIWQGAHWILDTDGAIMRLAKETVEAIYDQALLLSSEAEQKELRKHALRSQSEARLRAMVSLAQSEPGVALDAGNLDANPWLMGVQNGVVDLKTGYCRLAQREDLITKRTNVIFDAKSQCPNWRAFLDTVTGSDKDLQNYLQRVAGYTLTGSVREEALFVLYGTGCNGKSTLREVVHRLLGEYALAADASLLTERKNSGSATEEVARLKGRRFVAVNETSENDQFNEARIKFITSQDTISARNLYGHLFDFFPTHKTFLTTNHKPIIRETGAGIWRRVHLIPFTATIDKNAVEKNFREHRLEPEMSGILNWALQGLAIYQQQGLDPPTAVLQSTEEYRQDMDIIGQWIDERWENDANASVPTATIYADYSVWAKEEATWVLSKKRFTRHLIDRGYSTAKGTHGQRVIRGLRLKTVNSTGQTTEDTGRPDAADKTLEERIDELLKECTSP